MKLITPRKIAWLVIMLGVGWFIYVSPKTPLEFFDAAVRDKSAIRQFVAAKIPAEESTSVKSFRKWDEFSQYDERLERIALLYDLKNNPDQVNSSKYFIVEGLYSADEKTRLALRENDENYRNLQKERQIYMRSLESEDNNTIKPYGAQDKTIKEQIVRATTFRMQLESMVLRQFQVRLFWSK